MGMENVKELLVILIGSSLVSNVVLSQFLGLCPFLGVSRKTNTAAGMGAAVIFVIAVEELSNSFCRFFSSFSVSTISLCHASYCCCVTVPFFKPSSI